MIIENPSKIPEWLMSELVQEPRRKKPERMSTTDLIHTPRMRSLYIERFDDIVVDASTYFQMWYGNLLDKAFDDDENAQNKMEIDIDGMTLVDSKAVNVGKVTCLVGKWDCMREGIIQDYKFTGVGVTKYESRMDEYAAQLNIYDYLNNTLNFERAKGLENHFFYKDWSPVLASFDKSYPQCAWQCYKQPQWSEQEQHRYILERLKYHKEQPYDCPESERWSSFAIKRKGQKKAVIASVPGSKGKIPIKTEAHAKEIIKQKGLQDEFSGGNLYIENRLGLRCRFFCGVSSVCPDSPNCIAKFKGKEL